MGGMPSDKIQSRDIAGLTTNLRNTPKMLKWIKGTQDLEKKLAWNNGCFFVAFKLETDKDILMAKAAKSMRMYHQDVVVPNELSNYKTNVTLAFPGKPRGWEEIEVTEVSENMYKVDNTKTQPIKDEDPQELNKKLSNELEKLHKAFIE